MLSFRSVLRLRPAAPVAPPVAMPGLDGVHRSPLVPANNLRGHWVTTVDGKLELRWELPSAPSQSRAA